MLEHAERTAGRALAYRFLATMYLAEPRVEWLAGLAAEGLLDEFPVPPEDARMAQGLNLIASAVQVPDEAALSADYQRLFVGPARLPAPPWESVYRSEERLIFDWPALAVREQFRQMGLASEKANEPDDHIGLELLFMALMTEREADGNQQAVHVQRSFLQQHLMAWAPAFCDDLVAHAQTDLYRGLGLLTRGLLEQDWKQLSE